MFASGAGRSTAFRHGWPLAKCSSKQHPRPLGADALRVRATGAAFRHGWPSAKCSSQQRPRPLGAGVLQVRASGTVFRHGWPSAKCSSKQRPPALWGGCALGAGHGHCVSSRLACGQMFLTAAPPGPWEWVCFGCGPVALRFVTVGLRLNAPHSSAPALGGGCASGAGHGHCVSSRLACSQMFLKAAPPARGTRISKQVFHKEYSQC